MEENVSLFVCAVAQPRGQDALEDDRVVVISCRLVDHVCAVAKAAGCLLQLRPLARILGRALGDGEVRKKGEAC